MKRRILLFVLCLALLTGLMAGHAAAAELCDTVSEAAAVVREGMKDRETVIAVDYWAETADEISVATLSGQIFEEALAHTGVGDEGDYLRWHYGSLSQNAVFSADNGGWKITFTYTLEYYTTVEQEQEVTAAIGQALAQLNLIGKTDYEKIRAIYEYVADTAAYDYDNLGDTTYKLKHTAYSAIVQGKTVCQGYTTLLYRMLLEAGVDNRVIVGWAGEDHAWNIVRLEDQYYNLDVTWDEEATPINYRYFLKGSGSFGDHEPEAAYLTGEFMARHPISNMDYVIPGGSGSGEWNGWQYELKNGFAKIIGYTGQDEYVQVPAAINGFPVMQIGVQTFANNDTMRTLVIPEGVRTMYTVGDTSIFYCLALEKLVLPASLEVTVPKLTDVLVEGTFALYSHCPKLKTIEIAEGNTTLKVVDGVVYTPNMDTIVCYPSDKSGESYTVPETVTFVCHGSFQDQNHLKKVTLPDCVIRIGYWAFSNAQNLEELNMPADCRYWGQFAFANTKLKELHYPAGLGWMLPDVFMGTPFETLTVDPANEYYMLVDGAVYTRGADGNPERLVQYPIGSKRDTFVLPSSVTEMDRHVFYFAQNLRTVVLNDGLTMISDGAFFSAQNLERLVIPSSVTSIGTSVFANDWVLKEIYYEGTEEQWNSIMQDELLPEQIVHFNVADPETHSWATDTVEPPTCGQKGYTIYTCPCGHFYEHDYTPTVPHKDVQMMYYDEQYHVRFCYACSSYADSDPVLVSHNFQGNFCPDCHFTDLNRDPSSQPQDMPFTDVVPGAFYQSGLLWAVENNVTAGLTETTFGPNETCTRGQVVTFLWRAMGKPEPVNSTVAFTDVDPNAFYYKAVAWAVENGITSGTSATTFGPSDPCTRGHVVTFLYRTLGEPGVVDNSHPFRDVSSSAFYFRPMLWAVDAGVTNGTSETTFAPSDPCTRGQVVTFLYRALPGEN